MKDDSPPQTLDTTLILEDWRQFEAVAHDYLTPITTEDQNERALELLQQLWKAVPDGETTQGQGRLLEPFVRLAPRAWRRSRFESE